MIVFIYLINQETTAMAKPTIITMPKENSLHARNRPVYSCKKWKAAGELLNPPQNFAKPASRKKWKRMEHSHKEVMKC